MSEPGQKGKAGVVLRAVPRSFVSLRLGAGDVAADVGRAANLVLPSAAGAYASFEDRAAYWIAPDEWLLALADDEAELARLLQQLEGRAAAVDVTGGQRLFNLAGEFAAEVLQASTPYDCHPRVFPPGRCASTAFAKTTALIAAASDASFDLIVRSSYADYVVRWISAIGEQYGIALVDVGSPAETGVLVE